MLKIRLCLIKTFPLSTGYKFKGLNHSSFTSPSPTPKLKYSQPSLIFIQCLLKSWITKLYILAKIWPMTPEMTGGIPQPPCTLGCGTFRSHIPQLGVPWWWGKGSEGLWMWTNHIRKTWGLITWTGTLHPHNHKNRQLQHHVINNTNHRLRDLWVWGKHAFICTFWAIIMELLSLPPSFKYINNMRPPSYIYFMCVDSERLCFQLPPKMIRGENILGVEVTGTKY